MSERSKTAQNKKDAFTSLYLGSFDYVFGFVYARIGSAERAEEIVQETYAAVWSELDRFKHACSDETWIVSIARRKIADHYRKAIRRERYEEPLMEIDAAMSDIDLEGTVIGSMTKEHIAKAFAALNPVFRYALAMKYLDGLSIKEMAVALRRTPKAVDGILQRARASFIKHYVEIAGEDTEDGR